jgi:hypothetical protein
MNSIRADLEKLRQEAEKHDEYQCELAVKRLFRAFNTSEMMTIAVQQMLNYLPTFERYYPEETWVREYIDFNAQLKTRDESTPPFPIWDMPIYDENRKMLQGIFYFAGALQNLQSVRIFHLANDSQGCAWWAGGVVDVALSAFVDTYAFEHCRDLWDLRQAHSRDNTRPDEMSSERQLEIEITFLQLRECTKDYFKQVWFNFAEEIKRHLSKNES